MTGTVTLEIQELTRPELEEIFEDLGHDLVIVQPAAPANQWGESGSSNTTDVRGILMPASEYTQRSAAGAGLPIPSYEAYLPFDAPVNTPGWHLTHEGTPYHPTADARDEGGQGVVWIVPLRAPGQVTS
ncbi:hypothetical protein [Deinococcus hopiensis]|uniref:Uncharacterized protein n=1 Tax=Deinococcus hopiensis KR-140 TaxID=695939 RepID=A0A1W1V863_9DEIO|nr:hypothetical protein [Deinococcus hopiensis]SMB89194.1 hypothetical protein SAMN00790413_00303 [Deinococcus hopiensis KR-140]